MHEPKQIEARMAGDSWYVRAPDHPIIGQGSTLDEALRDLSVRRSKMVEQEQISGLPVFDLREVGFHGISFWRRARHACVSFLIVSFCSVPLFYAVSQAVSLGVSSGLKRADVHLGWRPFLNAVEAGLLEIGKDGKQLSPEVKSAMINIINNFRPLLSGGSSNDVCGKPRDTSQ